MIPEIPTQNIALKKYSIEFLGLLCVMSIFWIVLSGFFLLKLSQLIFVEILTLGASGLFFIATLWVTIQHLLIHSSSKPGLIIDQKGISGINHLVGIDYVPWGDIVEIKQYETPSKIQKNSKEISLVIKVKHPEQYLKQARLPWSKWYRQQNFKKHQTPLLITTHFLEVDANHLYSLLQDTLTSLMKNK